MLRQPRAVIAGKNNKRILVQAIFTQSLQHLPNAPVYFLNHISVQASFARSLETGIRVQWDMREGMSEIKEERFLWMILDERYRFLRIATG